MINRFQLFRTSVFVLALFGASAVVANGQGFVDGYTFGVGLSLYAGDVDGNPRSELQTYVGNSQISMFGGVNKDLNPRVGIGAELHYNRVRGINSIVDGTHSIFSFDVIGQVKATDWFGVYAGLSPGLVASSYSRLAPAAVLDGEATEGTRFALTIPVGVYIQDRIRVGLRIGLTDQLDGKSSGGGNDILGLIGIAYHVSH